MNSKEIDLSPDIPEVEEEHELLPSIESLLQFLKLYLDTWAVISIENRAKEFLGRPDRDTGHFVKKVEIAIKEKIESNRLVLQEVIDKLISEYEQQMERCENFRQTATSSTHSCGNGTINAVAMELIDDLEAIIPEARRSNWKNKASHTTKEELEDFLKELQEDLSGFMDERERDIIHRLNNKMDDFRSDLVLLSKQLRVVSKINLAIEILEREKIEEDVKKDIMNNARPIIKHLKHTKMTPNQAKNIFKLINSLKDVLKANPEKRFRNFRNAVDALEDTAIYACGQDISD